MKGSWPSALVRVELEEDVDSGEVLLREGADRLRFRTMVVSV